VREEEAIKSGALQVVDSEDEDEEEPQTLSAKEMIDLCTLMEKASIRTEASSALEFAGLVRKFRGELNSLQLSKAKQTTLEGYFA